mgnify:CR=1 FL=1
MRIKTTVLALVTLAASSLPLGAAQAQAQAPGSAVGAAVSGSSGQACFG